jgi:DNA polymerase III subunit delta'
MVSSPRLAEAVARFRAGLAAHRLAHAYLVVAPPRAEGLAFAHAALQLLYCAAAEKPCGACPACRHVTEHSHPDLAWLEPRMKSRAIGIEDIRELQRLVYRTSYAGGWKACVLMGADRLTEEASNAFLKTLEEPPARSLFLLLTDQPQAMLTTLLSRCQRVSLATELAGVPAAWETPLMDLLTAPPIGGSFAPLVRSGRLLALLGAVKQAVAEEEKAAQADDESVGDADDKAEILAARIEARYKEQRAIVLRAMVCWYRDLLACVCGADPAWLHFGDCRETLAAAAGRLTYRQALRNTQILEEAQTQLDRNVPEDMVLSAAIGRLTA